MTWLPCSTSYSCPRWGCGVRAHSSTKLIWIRRSRPTNTPSIGIVCASGRSTCQASPCASTRSTTSCDTTWSSCITRSSIRSSRMCRWRLNQNGRTRRSPNHPKLSSMRTQICPTHEIWPPTIVCDCRSKNALPSSNSRWMSNMMIQCQSIISNCRMISNRCSPSPCKRSYCWGGERATLMRTKESCKNSINWHASSPHCKRSSHKNSNSPRSAPPRGPPSWMRWDWPLPKSVSIRTTWRRGLQLKTESTNSTWRWTFWRHIIQSTTSLRSWMVSWTSHDVSSTSRAQRNNECHIVWDWTRRACNNSWTRTTPPTRWITWASSSSEKTYNHSIMGVVRRWSPSTRVMRREGSTTRCYST